MLTKEKDEELALFLEMRRRDIDKDKAQNKFLGSSDASLGSSVSQIPARKTAVEKFLDSENDKSDYDWLLTPPRTPSLEMESQKSVLRQNGLSSAHVVALTSRLTNIQEQPSSRTNIGSKRITLPSALNASMSTIRKPSSTSATRPSTPTARPSLSASTKPSRSSTPTSRATMPSSKPSGPAIRTSTPTRTITRSSTPIGRPTNPASKSASRSSTPTRQMPTSATASAPSSAGGRSSLVKTSASSTSNKSAPSRGNSPAMKSRPWKPNEMPGFSLDAPPNLRTTLPERPASVSRGRQGRGENAQMSCVETDSKGRPRRQSCSPARGRTTNSAASGGRVSMPSKSRNLSNGIDDVNPVLMGTKMVERVVNMRKLAPPKQDNLHSSTNSSSDFGRTLSKKSLDMALRHMDIRRSVPGKQRPLTSIPASSMYSVRSGGSTRSKPNSSLDSPHATSSNASSELSVNNSHFFGGNETELANDFGSEAGNSSPRSYSGK